MDAADFSERYGRWALVVGASDGLGAAFARALAERGLDVVLVARRQALLDDVASEIRAETGVDARTVAVDLTTEDAVRAIAAATSGLDVGLVVYCAGADPNYEPFLSQPIENALAMVERNCVAPMRICHHFAAPMQARGRGGIVLVSSGAGLVGGRNMVAYGATKAFDMVMAEALWAELHDSGVDVLGLVLGVTDTPALRRLLLARGQIDDSKRRSPARRHPSRSSPRRWRTSPTGRPVSEPTTYAKARSISVRCPATTRRGDAPDGGRRHGDRRSRARRHGAIDREVREDVAEVLVRYATGIDRRDWALFRSCFTDDCEADYGAIGGWHAADEITAWMRETHEPCGHTMHRITNASVTPTEMASRPAVTSTPS